MVFGFTSLWINVGAFLAAAAAIGVVGPSLSRAADRVGDVTGLGQTLAGALLLGASTSLPGLIVSLRTALQGSANLAVANSLGGIAAQTLFIAFADVALRSDTLQHRDTLAASLMQSAVLVTLLTLLLMGMLKPGFALSGRFHPLSLAVVAGVGLGFWTIQETRKHPSWRARGDGDGGDPGESADGRSGDAERASDSGGGSGSGGDPASESGRSSSDESTSDQSATDGDGGQSRSKRALFGWYLFFVVVVGISGALVSSTAGTIIVRTDLSPVVMGLTLTAVATSLPELVTAIASVRRGAVALAIGDIVGGNAFDTIMVALADFAYAKGSIYAAVTPNVPFVASVALLMTGVLAAGLVRRDRGGLASIGAESYLLIAIYAIGVSTILVGTVVPAP